MKHGSFHNAARAGRIVRNPGILIVQGLAADYPILTAFRLPEEGLSSSFAGPPQHQYHQSNICASASAEHHWLAASE
jgi:hypothetical protein